MSTRPSRVAQTNDPLASSDPYQYQPIVATTTGQSHDNRPDKAPSQGEEDPTAYVPRRSHDPNSRLFEELPPDQQFEMKYGRRITGNDPRRLYDPKSPSSADISTLKASYVDPNTLFIGRVGQPHSPIVRDVLARSGTQREFFTEIGYSDEIIGDSLFALGGITALLGFVINPVERARALAQADFASYRHLQTYNPSTDGMVTRGVTPGRLDYVTEFLRKAPNTNRVLFERPNAYETHVNRAINTFQQELLHYYNQNPPSEGLSSSKSASITLESLSYQQVAEFRSKHLPKYNNIHIFHTPASFLSEYQFTSHRDVTAGAQTIVRSYHITYVEPQLNSIRKALRSIFHYNSLMGLTRVQLLPMAFKYLSLICLCTFYLPWKSFTIYAHRRNVLPSSQFTLARLHATYGLFPYFFLYPLLATIGRRMVHKGLLFPNLSRQSDEFVGYLHRVREYHQNHQSFKQYLVNTTPKDSTVKKVLSHTETVSASLAKEMEKGSKIKDDIRAKSQAFKEVKTELQSAAKLAKTNKIPRQQVNEYGESLAQKLADPKYRATLTESQLKQQEHIVKNEFKNMSREQTTNTHDPKMWRNVKPEALEDHSRLEKTLENIVHEQQKVNKEREQVILDRLVARERNKMPEHSIGSYAMRAEGAKAFIRGMLPMCLGTMTYLAAFIPTYTILSSALIAKYHTMRSNAGPGEYEMGGVNDLTLETTKSIVPFSISAIIASYVAYPFSTIRSYIMASNTPGYVTLVSPNKAMEVTQPLIFNQNELKYTPMSSLTAFEEMKIATREIYRQGKLRGFYRGATIIPTVRIPIAVASGCYLFNRVNRYWKQSHEVIDAQHFFMHQPTL